MARPGLYSRLVAILKVGLPLIAVAMLAGLFLISEERGSGGELVFSPADLAALGSGMRIMRPVFSGVTEAEDRFRFTATEVTPDAAPPTQAEIVELTGRIDFSGGPGVDLEARAGALDLASQVMTLAGAVRAVTTDGYDLAADAVDINLQTGGLRASGSVSGVGPMGQITSDRLTVTTPDGGGQKRSFLFEDNVRLVYDPPDTAN